MPFISHDLDCAAPREYEHWLDLDANLLWPCKLICCGAGPSRGRDLEERLARHLRIESIPDGPYLFPSEPWMQPALHALNVETYATVGL